MSHNALDYKLSTTECITFSTVLYFHHISYFFHQKTGSLSLSLPKVTYFHGFHVLCISGICFFLFSYKTGPDKAITVSWIDNYNSLHFYISNVLPITKLYLGQLCLETFKANPQPHPQTKVPPHTHINKIKVLRMAYEILYNLSHADFSNNIFHPSLHSSQLVSPIPKYWPSLLMLYFFLPSVLCHDFTLF